MSQERFVFHPDHIPSERQGERLIHSEASPIAHEIAARIKPADIRRYWILNHGKLPSDARLDIACRLAEQDKASDSSQESPKE